MKIIALAVFALTYVLLLALPRFRVYVALCAAAIFVAIGVVPIGEAFFAVDWNVILMIMGTMGTVWLFIRSGMPALLSDKIIAKMPDARWATFALALFAGLISAFVDNVATVLIVAPVAIAIAKSLDMSPVPMVITIAVFSNLEGMATLVGDTTSILLGGYADMDFLDFFIFEGKMGLFFIVQIAALAAGVVLLYLMRKDNWPIQQRGNHIVKDYFPTFLLLGTVVLLICASFLPEKPQVTNGLICTGLFALGLLREMGKSRESGLFARAMKEIDWATLLLLCGLFIVIEGLRQTGIIEDISVLFTRISGDNVFLMYTLLVWLSVLFSAFIDNIPYVATMLPVVTGIAAIMGIEPYVLYFGLMTGATLGGNLTPIGASANITAVGILRKGGYKVSTWDFVKLGVPITLTAVLVGYGLIWAMYGI